MLSNSVLRPLRHTTVFLGIAAISACSVGDGNKPESIAFNTTVTETKAGNCAGVRLGVQATFTDGGASGFTNRVTWSSSDETIAKVLNDEGFEGTLIPTSSSGTNQTVLITATFGTLSATQTFTITPETLVSLSVVPQDTYIAENSTGNIELIKDVTTNLRLFAEFSDNSVLDYTTEADWSSDDETISTVINGFVSPLAAGTTLARATSCNAPGVTSPADTTFNIDVTETINSIDVIGEPNDNLVETTGYVASAIANLPNGGRIDISSQATWSIDEVNATPTVSNTQNVIFANNAGSGDRAQADYLGVTGQSPALVVDAGTLNSVTLTTSGDKLVVGSAVKAEVIASFSNGSNLDMTAFATFDADIVGILGDSISSPRFFTGVSVGSVNLTATFNSVADTVALEVIDGTVNTSNPLTVTSGALVNNRQPFTATAVYDRVGGGTETVDVTTIASWTTDNSNVIAINQLPNSGLIIDSQNGSTTGVTVTATLEGQSGTASFQ